MTDRRRNVTAAFWLIAAFTVILVTGLAVAGTLYQQQVNSRIRNQAYLSCVDRIKLQVEHNDLSAAVVVALNNLAASRRDVADTSPPPAATAMRSSADQLEHIAKTISTVSVSTCRK